MEKAKAEANAKFAALEKAKQEGEQAASALREKTKAEGLKTLAALEKAKQDSEKAAQDRLVKSENAAAAREDVSHSETRSALERVKKTQAYVDHLEGDITTAFTIKTDIPQDQIADPDRRRQLQAQMAKEIVRSLGVADTRVETIGSHADAKGVCFDVYFLPKDTHPSEPAATLLSRDLKLMVGDPSSKFGSSSMGKHVYGIQKIFLYVTVRKLKETILTMEARPRIDQAEVKIMVEKHTLEILTITEKAKDVQEYLDKLERDITCAFTIKTDIPPSAIDDPKERRKLQLEMTQSVVKAVGVAETRVETIGCNPGSADDKGVCFDVYFLPKQTHPTEKAGTHLRRDLSEMIRVQDKALTKYSMGAHITAVEDIYLYEVVRKLRSTVLLMDHKLHSEFARQRSENSVGDGVMSRPGSGDQVMSRSTSQ